MSGPGRCMFSKISQAKEVSVTWPNSYVESKELEVESRWDNEGKF